MVLTAERPLKALVIGSGSIGRRHIRNLKAICENAEIALLRDGGREDEFSLLNAMPVFGSLEDVLAWGPTLALIATPSDRHYDHLPVLLDRSIPTFVEKPVVVDGAQLDALESRDATAMPATQVGCVLRFMESVKRLKSWIEEGQLGPLIRARLECGQYLPSWRPGSDYRTSYSADSKRGGGVLFDLVHEIDLAVYLFGAHRIDYAFTDKRSSLEIQSEDVASLHLSGDCGVPISIGLDYAARRKVRNIEIVGDLGSARLDFVEGVLERAGLDGAITRWTDGFDLDQAFRDELKEWIDAVMEGGPTTMPLHEGLRSNRIAIRAREWASARRAS